MAAARAEARGFRLAITGTPGTGKTTLAKVAQRHGWTVLDLKEWAKSCGAVVGHDRLDDADVIDVRRLARLLPPREPGLQLAIEGHLSHLLPVDAVWVVRLDPVLLRPRLVARGYKPAKVLENLEAEALDLLLQEALAKHRRVVQRDGSRRNPEELYAAFADVRLDLLKAPDLEPVDWSGLLPLEP